MNCLVTYGLSHNTLCLMIKEGRYSSIIKVKGILDRIRHDQILEHTSEYTSLTNWMYQLHTEDRYKALAKIVTEELRNLEPKDFKRDTLKVKRDIKNLVSCLDMDYVKLLDRIDKVNNTIPESYEHDKIDEIMDFIKRWVV